MTATPAPAQPALAPAPRAAGGPALRQRSRGGPRAWWPAAWAAGAVLGGLLAVSPPASAHDTWLSTRAGAPDGRVWLHLGTGEQYPHMDSGVPAALLRQAACTTLPGPAGGPTQRPLRAQQEAADALWLHGSWPGATGAHRPALSCWAETQAQDTTLSPAEVAAYLDEVNASPALRSRWAALAAQGLPWRERFSKHARLELLPPAVPAPVVTAAADGAAAGLSAARGRSPLPLELVVEPADTTAAAPATPSTAGPSAAGPRPAALTLRLWRDGAPAAEHPVQLLGDELPRGLWLRTDAEGRLRLPVLPSGNFLLRGADLQPPAQDSGTWRSRFFSLRFQPGP